MANVVISIDGEGTATYLVNQYTEKLFPEAQQPRRASHVVPMGRWSRFLFQALRGAFGEDGRVSEWTRTWAGPWKIDMSPVGGPTVSGFFDRAVAIEYEINWLNANWLGRQ
jgi:hypothetical protein